MFNKGYDLATESIPGAVLQTFVWLSNPEKAGTYALLSIMISAMTTGYTSALIAFDVDIDVARCRNQPKFYGYIKDDNTLRGRTFFLMTLMGALHNSSRNVGYALLAASNNGSTLVLSFVGGEMLVYLLYKIARKDYCYWPRIEGAQIYVHSFYGRVIVKVIADFCGCIHFRPV